jgi:hypothetical protein
VSLILNAVAYSSFEFSFLTLSVWLPAAILIAIYYSIAHETDDFGAPLLPAAIYAPMVA